MNLCDDNIVFQEVYEEINFLKLFFRQKNAYGIVYLFFNIN